MCSVWQLITPMFLCSAHLCDPLSYSYSWRNPLFLCSAHPCDPLSYSYSWRNPLFLCSAHPCDPLSYSYSWRNPPVSLQCTSLRSSELFYSRRNPLFLRSSELFYSWRQLLFLGTAHSSATTNCWSQPPLCDLVYVCRYDWRFTHFVGLYSVKRTAPLPVSEHGYCSLHWARCDCLSEPRTVCWFTAHKTLLWIAQRKQINVWRTTWMFACYIKCKSYNKYVRCVVDRFLNWK
jgi:hypothetical protein